VIVRTLDEIRDTDREVRAATWISRRLFLRSEGMGFSLHDTTILAGTETHMCYRNHLEAVYCVSGEGSVEVVATGEVFPIRDGTAYALNEHDEHILRADTDLRMVFVFNPPLTGREVHDETGAYPLLDPSGEGSDER
jgi:L-ectoine synthase